MYRAHFLVGVVVLFSFSVANQVFAATDVSGVLSEDTIWNATSSPYVISGDVTVATGTTLSIEPGVIVKFADGNALVVAGALNAIGSSDSPIHFTSIYDDGVGGDTNEDADASSPAAGNWRSLVFLDDSKGTFEYVNVRYAGYGTRRLPQMSAVYNDGGELSVRRSEFSENAMFHIGQLAGILTVEDSSFRNGMYGVAVKTGDATVNSNRFSDMAIGLVGDGADNLSFSNNIFERIPDAIELRLTGELTLVHSNNTAQGGFHNGIVLRGEVVGEQTLTGGDSIPYIVTGHGGSPIGNGDLLFDQLSNFAVASSGALVLESGVVIKMGEVSQIAVEGTLEANGAEGAPVTFTSLYDNSVGGNSWDQDDQAPAPEDWGHIKIQLGGTAVLEHAELRYGGESSYLSGSALFNDGGTLSITGSVIQDNGQAGIRQESGTTTISESSLTGHDSYGVNNESESVVDARNNYWGDSTGPRHFDTNPGGQGNSVSDNVLFDPWKQTYCTEACYSNVVFLPGIKGSVLKMDDLIGSDTLWPSTIFSGDISELALNEDGTSVNDVYVDGILNTFYSAEIYANFANLLDEFVSNGVINRWLPLAYDWRFDPNFVIENGVKTESGTFDIIAEIEAAATSSKTGKVTIIGHSMGGLMGKAIIKKLEEEGKGQLVDRFVMVGSPQLGTPQAVTSLLHGDGEGIPTFKDPRRFLNSSIASPESVRYVGQNMPSSYNLLPSSEYSNRVAKPVLLFNDSSAQTADWYEYWGSAIDDHTLITEFLSGNGVLRTAPSNDDLMTPMVLREDLLAKADDFHTTFDTYSIPSTIEVTQIVGWGLPTVDGVLYTEEHDSLAYKTQFTREGDGVVVYPSANADASATTYYFNQDAYKQTENVDPTHAYLLSMEPVQDVITSVLKRRNVAETSYITRQKPEVSNLEDMLLVSAHSPVLLGVYDEDNNFTGTDGEEIFEEITGSYYAVFGESQYLFVPEDEEYTFVYEGTGVGSTTIELARVEGDAFDLQAVYSDMPTISTTQARFSIEDGEVGSTTIEVNFDGDGTFDTAIAPDDDVVMERNGEFGSSSGGGDRRTLSRPIPLVAGIATSTMSGREEIVRLLEQIVFQLKVVIELYEQTEIKRRL